MDLSKIKIGPHAPSEVNVVIEIPMNGQPVKYEIDKNSGALMVDRFLSTPMFYPANYGFIPETLGQDGDPIDALVLSDVPVVPGAVMRARPIGVLMMEDEAGLDEKILMVPISKLSQSFAYVQNYQDLPPVTYQKIEHFFKHYKDLETQKWVKISGWKDAMHAQSLIEDGIKRLQT